jgi:hypothetical protein
LIKEAKKQQIIMAKQQYFIDRNCHWFNHIGIIIYTKA